MKRRTFIGSLSGLVGIFTGPLLAQKTGIIEKGKAIVCDDNGEPIKCPLQHPTCRYIDAPIVVGNDSYQNPDVGQLRDYHVLRCNTCHVLFTRE